MAYTPPPNHYPPVAYNEGSQRWELTQPWHIWFLNLGRNLGLEQAASGSLDSRLTAAEADIDALEAAAGGSTVVSGTVIVTVPNNSWSHVETLALVGMTSSMKPVASIAAHLDSDVNDPELLNVVALAVTPATDAVTVELAFGEATSGPIKINILAV